MGIETRKNGNSYYYTKTRRNGRVVSEYVAGGQVGALAYALDRSRRAEREAEQAVLRERRRAEEAEERAAWGLLAEAQQLATLAMLATGHYRHKGQWRKRKATPMGIAGSQGQLLQELARAELAKRKQVAERAERAALPPLPAPGDYSKEATTAILKRADRTDATAEDLAALRGLLDARRSALFGDAGPLRAAFDRELNESHMTGLARELMRRELADRRVALGYDTAPALERPLIQHLLLCELRLGTVEQQYTAKWNANSGLSTEAARFWEQRLSAAQRRYLAAVEALARVRRVRVELARVLPDGTAEAVAVERPGV